MFIWNLSGFAEPSVRQKHDKIEKALPGLSDLDQHVECPRSKRTARVTKETERKRSAWIIQRQTWQELCQGGVPREKKKLTEIQISC